MGFGLLASERLRLERNVEVFKYRCLEPGGLKPEALVVLEPGA